MDYHSSVSRKSLDMIRASASAVFGSAVADMLRHLISPKMALWFILSSYRRLSVWHCQRAEFTGSTAVLGRPDRHGCYNYPLPITCSELTVGHKPVEARMISSVGISRCMLSGSERSISVTSKSMA